MYQDTYRDVPVPFCFSRKSRMKNTVDAISETFCKFLFDAAEYMITATFHVTPIEVIWFLL
jgi:hypothetical protein